MLQRNETGKRRGIQFCEDVPQTPAEAGRAGQQFTGILQGRRRYFRQGAQRGFVLCQ